MAIVAALRRILDSEELRGATRSRDFLAYVVAESLAGRGDLLKGRTVARYALGRSEAFDSATDAAARVQANRLRTALERYYSGTGSAERLVIELPRGGYVPRFTYRDLTPAPRGSCALEPGLVVVQFVDTRAEGSGEPIALALTESLIHALRAFPGLRVIGPAVSEQGVGIQVDARAVARALDAEYVLTGAVRTTSTLLRVMIRLSDGETGEVLWSDVSEQERSAVTGFHDEDNLVRRIAATVGDFRGVVLRDLTVRRAGTRIPAAHAATLSYYRYLDSGTRADTEAAVRDLRAALGVDPENVVLLTMLGSLEYVMAIMAWTPDRDAALADAERRARTALTLQPGYAHAWTVLAGVALRSGALRPVPPGRQPRDRAEPLPPVNPLRVRRSVGAQRCVGEGPGGHPRVKPAQPAPPRIPARLPCPRPAQGRRSHRHARRGQPPHPPRGRLGPADPLPGARRAGTR